MNVNDDIPSTGGVSVPQGVRRDGGHAHYCQKERRTVRSRILMLDRSFSSVCESDSAVMIDVGLTRCRNRRRKRRPETLDRSSLRLSSSGSPPARTATTIAAIWSLCRSTQREFPETWSHHDHPRVKDGP